MRKNKTSENPSPFPRGPGLQTCSRKPSLPFLPIRCPTWDRWEQNRAETQSLEVMETALSALTGVSLQEAVGPWPPTPRG